MANMPHCRFRNTANDLADCVEHLWDTLDGDEARARVRLVRICKRIADDVEDLDDLPIAERE